MRAIAALSLLLATVVSGSAAARDFAPALAANAQVVSPFNWTGFYFGADLGGSFGRSHFDFTITALPPGSTSQSVNGVLGGLFLGYGTRFDRAFVALEADFQGTSQRGSSGVSTFIPGTPGTPGTPGIPCIFQDGPNTPCIQGTGIPATPAIPGTPAVTGGATVTTSLPFFGTVRGRLGVIPADQWLLYVTGGLAYGYVTTTTALGVGTSLVSFKTDTIKAGWTLGGGVEAFIWNGWSARIEYLYIDFGNVGAGNQLSIAPITVVTPSNRLVDHIIRVGFSYHIAP